MARPPGKQKAEHIAQVVAGIRQQREGMRENSKDGLHHDVTEIQRRAYSEGASEIRGRMAVADSPMMMTVIVTVIMNIAMIVLLNHESGIRWNYCPVTVTANSCEIPLLFFV
jgi:hypothetical protein